MVGDGDGAAGSDADGGVIDGALKGTRPDGGSRVEGGDGVRHQQLRKISATALQGLGRPTSLPRTPDLGTALDFTGLYCKDCRAGNESTRSDA
jgi:hypothetical protein